MLELFYYDAESLHGIIEQLLTNPFLVMVWCRSLFLPESKSKPELILEEGIGTETCGQTHDAVVESAC